MQVVDGRANLRRLYLHHLSAYGAHLVAVAPVVVARLILGCALKAVALPAVEVHLSDVNSREAFRRISYPGMACERTFSGLGFEGYRQAIQYLKETYGA